MKKTVRLFLVSGIVMLLFSTAVVTVSAAPEDYINSIVDNISSAVENYLNNTSTEPVTEDSGETYEEENEPEVIPFETVTESPYDEYTYPTEVPTEEITEEPTEETTLITGDFDLNDEPDNNYYEYVYEPPTEENTLAYAPEILTEVHTDPPFLERLAITDDREGNVFIALGVWLSILSGIIIVLSVSISTHRRKKGV